MQDLMRSPLAAWENFYIIVGSSAGALTGLQFVVIALIADSDTQATFAEISAFGTPTIVHFCAVLLLSALLSAPWPTLLPAGIAVTLCGVAGVAYTFGVMYRARQQRGYEPILEDWVWYAFLPLLAYALLLVGGLVLSASSTYALAVLAAVSLILIFIGIHNAWDTVTYVAVDRRRRGGTGRE